MFGPLQTLSLVSSNEQLLPFTSRTRRHAQISATIALGVFVSTAATDAVYVLFNAAVAAHRRVRAASWSSLWYLLSAFAVISYTEKPAYALVAAAGSWVGAFASESLLGRHGQR